MSPSPFRLRIWSTQNQRKDVEIKISNGYEGSMTAAGRDWRTKALLFGDEHRDIVLNRSDQNVWIVSLSMLKLVSRFG